MLFKVYHYNVFDELIFHITFYFSAPGGDFQRVLDEDQVPFEQDVQRYLRQVAEGLQFMHQLNIAHLDIKVSFLFQVYNPCNIKYISYC